MHYAEVKYFDIANGEGVRTTLFVSGCRRGCPGCFNEQAWDFNAGKPFDAAAQEEVLASLEPAYVDGITILGGEPMEPENQRALLPFLQQVRERFPHKSIWLFSGSTYEELQGGDPRYCCEVTDELLGLLDVLVDGPFVQEKHDITLRFRGSSNQRVIDMAATRASDAVVLWQDDSFYATHTW